MNREEGDPKVEAFLEYLGRAREFDLGAYKRTTLVRRIEKRLQTINVGDLHQYVDYLERHPDEFTMLFNTILINVTEFFRDPIAWEYLAGEIIPGIIARQEQIRVWSAGCATGEEAYSATMMFGEALGIEQLRNRVKIYATDIDEEALNVARQGCYPARAVDPVPPPLLEKYFDPQRDLYNFHKEARRVVIFGRHDLIQDPPISRIDLLICRNTLMYFNTEAQGRILARFHFALNNSGYLFSGRAEMLLTHGTMFVPVDLKRRVFMKVVKPAPTDRLAMLVQANLAAAPADVLPERHVLAAFESGASAEVILDAGRTVVSANERARDLWRLGPANEGRTVGTFEPSMWPLAVQRAVETAYIEFLPARLRDVEIQDASGDRRHYEFIITPLRWKDESFIGVSVTVNDVSTSLVMQDQLHRSRLELQTVSEELQSSNEELETTNEELQSTVEELETTNEELQSTNEELETMNEELQSTNEELHTINDELRVREDALTTANAFLESVLGSNGRGLAVIDMDFHITAWTEVAEELWGVKNDEVQGKSFLNLDIGLPVAQLVQVLRKCLIGEHSAMTVEAVNRRGKTISCRVECTPLRQRGKGVTGALIFMEEAH
jgi:two-component system, chemotaxis family, CheB/CheR fusion protein